MIHRISIANITPKRLAGHVQAEGLSATITESYGAGAWGVEKGCTLEIAGELLAKVRTFVMAMLTTLHEEAAYVVTNGACAELWNADGSTITL